MCNYQYRSCAKFYVLSHWIAAPPCETVDHDIADSTDLSVALLLKDSKSIGEKSKG